jgi:acyl-coenzyme A thioesterase PaaI-like protein
MCGDRNPWSLRLRFRADDANTIHARFQGSPELQGYDGVLHGGIIAALLDAAMTNCLFHHGIEAVTGDLRVRFLQPIPCMALLNLRAWMLSETRSLYRVRAELAHHEQVMAWAEARFMERELFP